MEHPRFLLVLAIGTIAVAGCSKDKKPEQPTEQKFAVSEYEPDLRDYQSSWGHQGRGGAALRKSAYQHVVSPSDRLDTRSGRLHPELQVASTAPVAMIAIPLHLRQQLPAARPPGDLLRARLRGERLGP